MADTNYTGSMVSEFIIVGFPGLQDREVKAILFAVFLTVYLLILLGNLLLICILAADRHLHTPIYVVLFVGLSVLLIPLFFIVLSYVKILLSVLSISSSAGRAKAVSTCSSHLLVISVFYLTIAGVFISYRIPGTSVDMRVMGSVIHNVFPALMNPIIYCLRTKEIRGSLVKSLNKNSIFPGSK
ncbi:olfactory receptor 2AT4-like [Amia ocellicauda]|uniref:olfactory receptor 2AT4-like n=1 Tax=Amia ocellicauda TaxID=2972642 RepID=UPI00346494B6